MLTFLIIVFAVVVFITLAGPENKLKASMLILKIGAVLWSVFVVIMTAVVALAIKTGKWLKKELE